MILLSPSLGITIAASIVVFLIFLLALLMVILYAKAKLTSSGLVKLTINGEKTLEVNAGDTILSTLGGNKIFLPSACGGGGTCAMCKCQVLEGGGEILPTEAPYFTRKEIQEKWRLGCQVKVKQDMNIQIPDEIFGIKQWVCTVTSNNSVATFIKELDLALPEGEVLEFQNGGYIQIDIPKYEIDFEKDIKPGIEDEYRADWDNMKLWDLKGKNSEGVFRAYSMANHPAEGSRVTLNVRIATPPFDRANGRFMDVLPGLASTYMYSLKTGDKVTISGPYGEFFIQETEREMLFLGGGAGMAPMRSHIFHLFHTEKTTRKATFFYGARSVREMFYDDEFKAIQNDFDNFNYVVGLSDPLEEDNWTGPVGFIHDVAFNEYLKDHPAPEDIEYYLCGPPMMLSAVMSMLDNLGVEPEMIRYDEF
ncbi:MAG TPA: NADH:ubiquinone reductase (Na(+)-transporting) subunit F [Flavobacteriales bacterium]|nr:NADH:ubiquinone reductase (Na(+)-transporting) subunit F [Flavobacteriales bacterium]HIO68124.1 NADH:ubiquinone reductase (Na(+)-transporting) subunit F [Flavobacteriales bacterium]